MGSRVTVEAPVVSRIARAAANRVHTARVLTRAGIVRPIRPDRIVRVAGTLRAWGPTIAAGAVTSAVRHPREIGLIDERGTLTFGQIHERSNALADALAGRGVGAGDRVAVMCRNHRGFVEAVLALAKLGADALLLNTAFSGPQLAELAEREQPQAVVFDGEFAGVLSQAGRRRKRFIAWPGPERSSRDPQLEDLIAEARTADRPPPARTGKVVILTSGTTGAPKGATRSQPSSLDPVAALLDVIPLRARERTMIAAPMFHSWGFAHYALGLALSSTVVLRRRFDPEATLALTAQHGCTALVVVPVMLQRILELEPEVLDRYDLSRVRVVAVSGSALPGDLSERWMDRFGEQLYNLYGSTEIAWATVAAPADLRAAPGTAGRPPRGTVLRLYDEHGRPVPAGVTGRIFAGNEMQFEGYTGGGGKAVIDGLMSSGDVGHLDAEGRLFVDGRDDDMIVSGGENVYPSEVEDLLARHAAVADVAVLGVEDEQFGQRLRAVLVLRPGAALSDEEVRGHVREHLAGYKVPRDVVFADELPRTSTGKVLKREL